MDIEAQLRRFEFGESQHVKTDPMLAEMLEDIGRAFVAQYENSGDLRYLNAVLKIVDRHDFQRAYPAVHRKLSDWAGSMLGALRRTHGLA